MMQKFRQTDFFLLNYLSGTNEWLGNQLGAAEPQHLAPAVLSANRIGEKQERVDGWLSTTG